MPRSLGRWRTSWPGMPIPTRRSRAASARRWNSSPAVQDNRCTGRTRSIGLPWLSRQLATLEIAPPFVTFVMERGAGEQGKTTDLFCKIQQNTPFQGAAKVRLVGVPAKVTVPEVEISKDSKDVAFKLTLDKASPPGQHNNLFCQVFIMHNGELVLHNVGGTQLRIDVPI